VLALSMKLDGRADHEIERVLLSRVDFTTTDVPSLLYSAAFLNRLEGKRPALRLYRQASEINPRRPEPYVLGLKLARELGDIDAIQWACTGILRHAWTEDYRSRHQKAEDAAKDLQKDLLRAGKRERAAGFRDAMAQARRRDVMIRVEWSGDGDLDLSVSEPLDTTCSILQPRTASGGVLLHDGYGPSPENCYEEYVCVKAPSGRYELTVNYLDGKIVGKRCQVTMTLHQGTPGEKVFRQSVRLEGPSATVSFDLQNGRREQPLAKPQPLVKPTGALRRIPRQQMLARVRRIGRRQEGDIPVAGPAAQAGIKHRGNVAQGAGVAQAAGMAQPGGIVRAAGGPAQPAAPNPGFRLPAGSFTAGVGFQPVIGVS